MKKIFYILTILMLGLVSCEEYLDINKDPNSPSTDNITSEMVFPGAEMNLASSYGDFLRIVGGYYAQQYAHNFGTSNYLDYSQFKMSATRSSGTFTQLYTRTLGNLETIRKSAEAEEEWGTYLAATTLRAFTYQALVDAYGEVPYTEALDIAISSPAYDDGKTIYTGILAELDFALSKATATSLVCTNFLFGTSTAAEWIPFANALKLKILMRMSNVETVQTELAALISANNFPTSDVSWDDCWADETGKASPFYQEEYANYFGSTQINVVANLSLQATMSASSDARLAKFFSANDEGKYTGGISGTNFSNSPDKYNSSYLCRPVFTYDMPVNLITVSEVEFFKAEYEARYGSAVEAEKHYKAAIEASFISAGLTAADAAPIYTNFYPYNNADYAELIGIQKWIALSGTNNYEAWCELRRLGYPAFSGVEGLTIYGDASGDEIDFTKYTAGTLYTPIKVNSDLGASKLLQRFPYAESSVSRNSNAPATKKDNVAVFWVE